MPHKRKTLTVAGAFVGGCLAGYVIWLLAGRGTPELPRRRQAPRPSSAASSTASSTAEVPADSPVREPSGGEDPAEPDVERAPQEVDRVDDAGELDRRRGRGDREGRPEVEAGGGAAVRGEAGGREGVAAAPVSETSPEPSPAAVPTPPPGPLDPSWRVPGAPFRQIVEVYLVPAGAGRGEDSLPHSPIPVPKAARCAIAFCEIPARLGRVRVFDTRGREVRSGLVAAPHGGERSTEYDLYFEARGAKVGDRFEVYYPLPGRADNVAVPTAPGRAGDVAVATEPGEGDVPELEAGPSAEGDLVVAVYKVDPAKVRGDRRVRRLRDVVEAMKGSKPLGKPRRRSHIDDRESPYGPNDNYVAVYQAYLACARSGNYEFGVDADDVAVLVIDGREVLTGGRPGRLPDRPFPYRTRRNLKAGLHAITLYHVQTTELLRARLAWKPPGANAMRIIPPSAFVSHIQARPVALGLRDRPGPAAFFRAEPVRRLAVNRKVPVTLWELVATEIDGAELPGDLAFAKWVWREGERRLGEGRELRVHVSGLDDPASRAVPYREITLALETERGLQRAPGLGSRSWFGEPGQLSGEHSIHYVRRIGALDAPPEEAEKLTMRLELASAPSFVYPHEALRLTLRAINNSAEPVLLEVVERRWNREPTASPAGLVPAGSRTLGEFELPAAGTGGRDVLARRMNVMSIDFAPGEYARLGRLVYLLGPPRAPAVTLSLEFLPSREQALPSLHVEGGGFATGTGVRALFVLPYDRESDHRRFAFLKKLAWRGGDPRKALLYGDDLASPGARGGAGLVPRMRTGLGEKVALRHVGFPKGGYPICAAVAGIDRVLLEDDWGRIWISLGTLDVRTGTPVREFRRGLDVLIDRVRVLRPGARLVIAGPPPEWTRQDISRRYAVAASEVARQHHVPLAELHELVEEMVEKLEERNQPPGSPWREGTDSVYFPYPLGSAMDEIAREVLGR